MGTWNKDAKLDEPMKDETVVFVLTPDGQQTGVFLWPKSQTWILKLVNGSKFGCHFAWNDKNDMTASMSSEKLPGIDGLMPEEFKELLKKKA